MKSNILNMPTDEIVEGLGFDKGYQGMYIPEHTRDTLQNYLLKGWEPGGFVTACLANDLSRAVSAADHVNRKNLWAIVMWITNNAPHGSWGSYEAVKYWCKDEGGIRSSWAVTKEKEYVWNTLKDPQ